VALKVLPEPFAADRQRLERFDREARILASLNHPHIATIHGLAESDSGPALVLELVEGLTLDDRLTAGPLSLDETLNCGRQIAEALEAAHEQGIVHRDLKPANIKIRPDGTVKVLDFGIAKILEARGSDSGAVQATTLTETGAIVGTAYYMSPEQARGEEVTRRSDVWAFGVILFEMLTGTRAFAGATRSDVLAAILRATPDWSALPPATPTSIIRLVRRCLARDPKARLHDIGDARLEIEDVERSLQELPAQPGSSARPDSPRGWRRAASGIAAIVGLAAVAAAVYAFATRGDQQPPNEVRLQMPPPPGTHFVSVPAVSPDGASIAFVAAADPGGLGRLWVRPLSAAAATEIPGSQGAIYPFWSWDSRSIAFFADGKLKRVRVAGGNPIAVCNAERGRGGVWLEDETIVFAPDPFSRLMRVNASGGTPAPFTTLAAGETGHRFPQRLDGRYLAYFAVAETNQHTGTRVISIDAPDRSLNFLSNVSDVQYIKGSLVFVRSSSVLAQPFTLPNGQGAGEPVQIAETRISENLGHCVVATSPSGVIATMGPVEGVGQLTWMSRDGRVLETVGSPARQLGLELSPDGQQVVMATTRSLEIWTMTLERPVPSLVRGGIADSPVTVYGTAQPIWSPDGTRVLATSTRGVGSFDLAITTLATGAAETVVETGPAPGRTTGVVKPLGWLSDGRTIVWANGSSKSFWTMPLGDPKQTVEFLDDGAEKPEGRLSPDGRWIAYSTNRSGRYEVEVRSFPKIGPAYPVSLEGGGYPRWRADGRGLFYLSASSRIMAATFTPGNPPAIGRAEPLFEVRVPSHPNRFQFDGYGYDVSKDGSRFLVNRLVSEPESSMSVIVNWRPPR
jgi:Tol biopolymer transport system component